MVILQNGNSKGARLGYEILRETLMKLCTEVSSSFIRKFEKIKLETYYEVNGSEAPKSKSTLCFLFFIMLSTLKMVF